MKLRKLVVYFEAWVSLVVILDLLLVPWPPRLLEVLGVKDYLTFFQAVTHLLVLLNLPYQVLLGRSAWGLGYFLNGGLGAALKYAALSALAYQLLLLLVCVPWRRFQRRQLPSARNESTDSGNNGLSSARTESGRIQE